MRIETADMTDTDRLADLWVALAQDQRTYGSYLLPEENRDTIRETVARHIVTGGLLVARTKPDDEPRRTTTDCPDHEDSDGEAGTVEVNDGEGGGVPGSDAERSDGDDGAEKSSDEGECIVGFVMFGPETGSYDQDVTKGVIQNIYVAPAWRGTGIGADLLAAAETAMVGDGMQTVVLDVMASNDRARAFYRRHGYREHRVTMAKDDVGENDMHSREH